MTTLKSILLLSLVISSTKITSSCLQEDFKSPANKMFIVIDKSESVEFENPSNIASFVKSRFQAVYGDQEFAPEIVVGWIDNMSGIETFSFSKAFPQADPSTLSGKTAITRWRSARARWFGQLADTLSKAIVTKSTAKTTDIFKMVRSIEAQKNKLKTGETLEVLFFSDMIHETSEFNLKSKLQQNDPGKLGKQKFKELKLSNRNSSNVLITVKCVYRMENYGKVEIFWETFFKEWGMIPPEFRLQK